MDEPIETPEMRETLDGNNSEAVESANQVLENREQINQAQLSGDAEKVKELETENDKNVKETIEAGLGISMDSTSINTGNFTIEQKNILQTFLEKFIAKIKELFKQNNTNPQEVYDKLKQNPSESVNNFGSFAKYIVTLAILASVITGIVEVTDFLNHAASEASGCYQIDMTNGTNTKISCGTQSMCSCAQFTQLNNQCGGNLTPCSGSLSSGSGVVYQWKTYTPADILSGMIKSVGEGIGGFVGGVFSGIFDSLKKYIIWIVLILLICLIFYGAYRFMSK